MKRWLVWSIVALAIGMVDGAIYLGARGANGRERCVSGTSDGGCNTG